MRSVRVGWGRFLSVVGAGLLVSSLAACAVDQPVPSGPYSADFAQARQQAVTDFQRGVLKDGRITDAEFREVRQRYIDCLADAGVSAIALPDGSYQFDVAPTGEQEKAERRCSDETIAVIEPLYYAIRVNPRNEDFSALIVECLRQQGVVQDSFTKKDWDRFVDAFAAAQGGSETPVADLPTLPGGVAMDDSRVQKCSSSPLDQ